MVTFWPSYYYFWVEDHIFVSYWQTQENNEPLSYIPRLCLMVYWVQ